MHTVRPATLADAALLFAWRNDPQTRAMCLSTDAVAWPDHLAWLERVIADPARELSIHETNGVPCGTTRLDWDGDTAEFSITVAPEFRGRFVVKTMFEQGLPEAPTIASIRADNRVCQRLVRWFGFTLEMDGPVQHWTRRTLAKAA